MLIFSKAMDTYSERITSAMKASGFTVSRLAQLLDISYNGVKKVADGRSPSGFNTRNHAEAARILKVSPDWLATGKGPMEPGAMLVASHIKPHAGEARDPELSPSAVEIGHLFDLLSDRVDRAVAYNAATEAILRILNARNESPSPPPGQADRRKKPLALSRPEP